MIVLAVVLVLLVVAAPQPALGFAVGPASGNRRSRTEPPRRRVVDQLPLPAAHQNHFHRPPEDFVVSQPWPLLMYAQPSSDATDTAAAFEYQELKIQLDALQRAGISPGKVNPIQRIELLGYVKEIVARRQKPSIPISAAALRGTSWKMAFSHGDDASALGDLPSGASVVLRFANDDDDDDKLHYALEFGPESLGLRNLVAHSTWRINQDDDDNAQNGANSLTYTYERITSDLMGFRNVPVGLFGLLKGRTSSIYTAYFDGTFWIEQGYGPSGKDYCNVYVRER